MPVAAPGFAVRLKAALDAKGWSQAELSRASGVGRPTIIGWLRGEPPKQRGPVEKAALALGVSADELWGEAPELAPDERTRLLMLEQWAERVIALAGEITTTAPTRVPDALPDGQSVADVVRKRTAAPRGGRKGRAG